MKTLILTICFLISAGALAGETAKRTTASANEDCAVYVKGKGFPSHYCQAVTPETDHLTLWVDSLKRTEGPIKPFQDKLLQKFGCEIGVECGMDTVQEQDIVTLEEGNDSNGGYSVARVFVYFSGEKARSTAYIIDVRSDFGGPENEGMNTRRILDFKEFIR